jgi:hypothetical protein
MPILPVTNLDSIQLCLKQRISTKPNSIFYTLIPLSKGFLGIYRHHYASYDLGVAFLNDNFDIIIDHNERYGGVDPRSFMHLGEWYIIDNSLNRNRIIRLQIPELANPDLNESIEETNTNSNNQDTFLPIFEEVYGPESGDLNYSKGKNFTYISEGEVLYQVRWFYPLEIYRFEETMKSTQLVHKSDSKPDDKYRGGTPGYSTGYHGEYIGFGHYTITQKRKLKHLPFVWKLNIFTKSLETRILDLKPIYNIMDPVAVISLDDKFYLITAESHLSWFSNQDYVTNIWEIIFD